MGSTTSGSAELIADFNAQIEGEIDLKKGESVRILEVKESGCLVERADGSRGVCPIKFLKKVDANVQQQRPVYDLPVYEPAPSRPLYDKPVYDLPVGGLNDQPSKVYEHLKPDEDQPYSRALYDFRQGKRIN